jgi:hypothetical protein
MTARAAMPEGAAAKVFEDSFARGDSSLGRTDYPMSERGAVHGRFANDAPVGNRGSKLNERPIPAERVITDPNVDAGFAPIYAAHLSGAGAAPRANDFTYRIR